jgi:hypothetical protein
MLYCHLIDDFNFVVTNTTTPAPKAETLKFRCEISQTWVTNRYMFVSSKFILGGVQQEAIWGETRHEVFCKIVSAFVAWLQYFSAAPVTVPYTFEIDIDNKKRGGRILDAAVCAGTWQEAAKIVQNKCK